MDEELHRSTVQRIARRSRTYLLLDSQGCVYDTVGADLSELLGDAFDLKFTGLTRDEVIKTIADQRDPFGPNHLDPIEEGKDVTEIPLVTCWQVFWVCITIGEGFIEIEPRTRREYTDSLTGLFDRRGFERLILRRSVNASRAAGRTRGIFIGVLDVDDFKSINTEFGHLVGDDLLVQISRRLREACPNGGYIARWGGDEFAVVVPAVTRDESTAIAQGLELSMNSLPYDLGPTTTATTVTIGGAWSPCKRRSDIDTRDLFRLADKTLLGSKAENKGTARVCDITQQAVDGQ